MTRNETSTAATPPHRRGGVMIVVSSCVDHEREAEFRTWYQEVHLPDVLRNRPQIASATFSELAGAPDGAPPRYLALYEVHDDVDGLLEQLAERRLAQSELIKVEHFGVFGTTFELTRDDL